MPRHIGIFGVTGAGKTNAELVVNAAILSEDHTVGLMFDFHGELLEGKGMVGGEGEDLNVGLQNHPASFKLNYYGGDQVRVSAQRLETRDIVGLFPGDEFTSAQVRLARGLERDVGRNWIQQAMTKGIPPGIAERYALPVTSNTMIRKLADLPEAVFPQDGTFSVADECVKNAAAGRSSVVDLSGLAPQDQKRVAFITARHVVEHYKRAFREEPNGWKTLPTLMVTLEEAHEFLSEEASKSGAVFPEIAMTYRKYNVGLCVVTPRPSNIDRDVFSQLGTKIVLRMPFEKDRQYIMQNTPGLEYSDMELKSLDDGEALLTGPSSRFPLPIKVMHYPSYLKGLAPSPLIVSKR